MSQTPTPADCLRTWLAQRLPAGPSKWLDDQCAKVVAGNVQTLFLAFGLVPRKTGKADLALTSTELAQAAEARPGWYPRDWSVDQAARTLLLLQLPAPDAAAYVGTLDQMFAAGEVGELVALYQALPLLPHPAAHVWRARECVRTNMKAVFTALAHHNPYPSEQLDEASWNQLILKCLFVGVALDPVVGIDERSNAILTRMLTDYAHERWAAKRMVLPELWRPVGHHADDVAVADLEKVLTTGTTIERQAAVLALRSSKHPNAAEILRRAAHVEPATWAEIAEFRV